MSVNNIELGYGGNATIDGNYVLITGGSLSKSLTIPFVTPYDTPVNEDSRIKVKMGDGVYAFSGNISFDMSLGAVENLISDFFIKRNKEFKIEISDGYRGYSLDRCKFDSLSFSASAGSLFTGSISFQSIEDFTENISSLSKSYLFQPDNVDGQLVKYWHTGAFGVESFTININQSLTPVYLNVDDMKPQYIRAGLWDLSFEINAWDDWYEHEELKLGKRRLKILNGESTTWNYSYGGLTETGSHSHTYIAYATDNSDSKFFQIT